MILGGGFIADTAATVAKALYNHYPPGAVWSFEEGTRFYRFLHGLGDELSRVQNKILDLLQTESDWSKTDEMLEDWERVAGLPDHCNTNPATDKAVRRKQLHGKMTASGGQSPSYYKEIADRVTGQACTLTEFSRAHYWHVSIPNNDVDLFQAGDPPGTPLAQYTSGVNELMCLFDRIKPAHTIVTYIFPNDDPAT